MTTKTNKKRASARLATRRIPIGNRLTRRSKGLYRALVWICRAHGLYVEHIACNKEHGWQAVLEVDDKKVVIHKDSIDTMWGAETLAHELGHWIDYRNKRFYDFFKARSFPYTKKNFRLVEAAEKSAARRARAILKACDIDFTPEELVPSKLPRLRRWWRKYYFD